MQQAFEGQTGNLGGQHLNLPMLSSSYIIYYIAKVCNFLMDFHAYQLYIETYTQKYSYLNTENLKKLTMAGH